jgi:hypothetical protein
MWIVNGLKHYDFSEHKMTKRIIVEILGFRLMEMHYIPKLSVRNTSSNSG